MRKCALISTVILLCLVLLLPVSAASIENDQFSVALRTPITMLNFSSATSANPFPVVDVDLGIVGVSSGELQIKLYAGGALEDSSSDVNAVSIPINQNVSDVSSVFPFSCSPNDFVNGWTPTLWNHSYWSLTGSNNRLILEWFPSEYPHPTATGGQFWFRCYTDGTILGSVGSITGVNISYHSPDWTVYESSVVIGSFDLNGHDDLYFQGMTKSGYYTYVLSCIAEDGSRYSVYLDFISMAGLYDTSMNFYLSQTVPPDLTTGASYEFGYNQGFLNGKESMQSAVQDAYTNGYIAGENAVDGTDGIFTSALLAIGEIPFNMMMDIMDFNILGINFSVIVTMCVTGVVLIFLVKKLLI